jgi:hypothetical protein
MVVNLICVLVESSKGIDLVIAAESDRGVYKTRRPLTYSPRNQGSIAIGVESSLDGRIGHQKSVV